MNNGKDWDSFFTPLFCEAVQRRQATRRGRYMRQREEHLLQFLDNNLTPDGKTVADEVLTELDETSQHEAMALYRQGMRDCVRLLRHLGVLA